MFAMQAVRRNYSLTAKDLEADRWKNMERARMLQMASTGKSLVWSSRFITKLLIPIMTVKTSLIVDKYIHFSILTLDHTGQQKRFCLSDNTH